MQKSSNHIPSGGIVVIKRDDGTNSTLLRCRATNSRAADAFTTPRLALTSADQITFLNAVQGTRPLLKISLHGLHSPIAPAAEGTSFAFVRTSSGVAGYVQTKYLVSAPQHSVAPSSPASTAPPCKFHAFGNCHRGASCKFSHASSHVSPHLAHSTPGPSLQNFCNRVLAVDREQNSFVPIIGLDKAADMTIDDALLHALRGCSKLQSCLSDKDVQVRRPIAADTLTHTLSLAHVSSFCQAIASAARSHFLRLSSPDPFGVSEHHAAAIHACAPRLTCVVRTMEC